MLKERFKELQDKLLAEVKSFYGDRLVSFVVFGSVARETYRFDSDIDFIPTEEYTDEDASEAIEDARFVVDTAKKLINLNYS